MGFVIPLPPVPIIADATECAVSDVTPGMVINAQCYGVLLSRAYVINYEAVARDDEMLRANWPTVKWYQNPKLAFTGGAIVGAALVLLVVQAVE